MTTYPSTDSRRVAELRAHLRRLAAALTPAWARTGHPDDFGSALLEIAARLAEQTTQRLDGTAQRDAAAFFDFLGLPPTPPRAATGVLAMTLTEKRAHRVYAPARTQVIAGDDVTFETQRGLSVVPGRIDGLFAVDPATDRIEQAPAGVSSPAPSTAQPVNYQVLTFADAGSRTLQLSPAAGLTAGDLLRAGESAYRIAAVDKTGLVTLQDPLEASVAAGDTVRKIVSLAAFTLRNLQSHTFAIGHKELFKLDQPAVITLGFAPSGLARELSRLDLAYSMYGTREEETEPRWHDLDLLGTTGARIELAKSWPGTTDETEVGGQKTRWVRAELRGPVAGRASLTSRASQVRVGVKSLNGAQADAGPESAEGSRTIARAAHNGTPLSTARRFFPFGPEPLRFDVFAIAAPEALSKKGARVTVDIKMADASLTSFEITAAAAGSETLRGYGVGANGYLEILSLGADGGFTWQELPVVDPHGVPVLLDGPATGVELMAQAHDLVVVGRPGGGLGAARITRTAAQVPAAVSAEGWQQLSQLTGAESAGRRVVVPAPAWAAIIGIAAAVFDVAEGVLHALLVNDYGKSDQAGWQKVNGGGEDGLPSFTGDWRIVPVQDADWPGRPVGPKLEMVVIDGAGAVWFGVIGMVLWGRPLTVAWQRLKATAAPAVIPAATRFRSRDKKSCLWIAYGSHPDNQGRCVLKGMVLIADAVRHVEAEASITSPQRLHANPAIIGVDGHPVTVGLGSAVHEAFVWLGPGHVVGVPLGSIEPASGPLLLRPAAGTPPELVVPGKGERLHRTPTGLAGVDYRLHDLVALDSPEVAHWVEITGTTSDGVVRLMVRLSDANRRIKHGDLRIYQIDDPNFAAGQSLNFLRLVLPSAEPWPGAFDDPDDRTRLRLSADDTVTRAGMYLIIGNDGYPVADVSAERVATLGFAVAGEDPAPTYQPAQRHATSTVQAADLRTLVELSPRPTIRSTVTLYFAPEASPAVQKLSLQHQNAVATWVRLGDEWQKKPPDKGQAVVAESLTTPNWGVNTFQRGYQNPEVSWEYFDQQGWRALGLVDGTANLSTSGKVSFTVPADLSTTEIGGKDDHWIRARLVGGDYGRPAYVVRRKTNGVEVQTVTVDTSALRPPEILAIEAVYELVEQTAPEIVLVTNNLEVRDETRAAATAGARFELLQGVSALEGDVTGRSVHVGLTTAIGAAIGKGLMTFLVDADDQEGTGRLRADLRTTEGWRRITVDDDQTRCLRRRGMITMSLDTGPTTTRLFGQDRIWLRLRPEPPDASWAPVVHRMLVNAVGITQARTMPNEVLGSSLGEPGLTVELAERPVLPDTVELRVREDLSHEELTELQARQPGEQVVRLNPDGLPGTWVLWRRVDSLIGCDGDARVYVLDPASGRVRFGDGRTGMIPPAGRDNIRCFTYQQGGGPAGNLRAWSPVRPASALESVETVVLPVDTAGGYGAPPVDSLFATAPDRLRRAGQATSTADIEALAVEASAGIVRAHCARPARAGGPIRVTIAVRGESRCPVPTLAQRDAVAAAVRAAGWGGLGEKSVVVGGPDYLRVGVAVVLVAAGDRQAEVEHTAKDALTGLLHPITGGPDGTGWPFGRRPVASDLLRVLSEVPGLDRVTSVDITAPRGRSFDRMPANGLVYAEVTDIDVTVNAVEGTS